MDGSAAGALANEVTITTTGLLIFGILAITILTYSLIVHLRDCSGHRKAFHEADRHIEERLASIETDLKWIRHSLGRHGPYPTTDGSGGRGPLSR